MDNDYRLPERLKSRRKELGLTLAQVAERVGTSEATVQRWENGSIKTLRHESIVKLADVLDVSPSYLMGWLDRLNELYIEGNISKAEYERRRTALEAQISTLTAVKGNVPKVFNGTWKEAYKRLDEVKKNILWKSVVDCIIVNADKTISIKFAH